MFTGFSAHLYADERLLHAVIGRRCSWLRAAFSWLGLAAAPTYVMAATTHRFLCVRVESTSFRELAFEAMPWHELEHAAVHRSGFATKLVLSAHGGRWRQAIRIARASQAVAEGIVLVWSDEHARPTTRRRTFVPFAERVAS